MWEAGRSDNQQSQHLLDTLILAFWEPDGRNVGVGEALFETSFLGCVARTGEDGVVVRQRVSAHVLCDLGEGRVLPRFHGLLG